MTDAGAEWVGKLQNANEDLKGELIRQNPQFAADDLLKILTSLVDLVIKIYNAFKAIK